MARSVSNVAIKVSVDDKDLQSLSNKFNKLEKEMKEVKGELKKLSSGFSGVGKEIKAASESAKTFFDRMNKMGKGVRGVGIKFLFLKHLVTQAFDMINEVYEKIREGAAFEDMRNHLRRTAEGWDDLSDRAQFASAGMLSKEQVAKSASLMKQFGMDISRIDEVSGLMAKTAVVTGESVDHMLDSFTRGVARLSPLILDNLGITISLKEAYQDYAGQLGVTTDQLTKADQMQAVFNESLRVLSERTKDVNLAESLTVQLEDFVTALRDAEGEAKAAMARGLFGGGKVGTQEIQEAFNAVKELAGAPGTNLVDIMDQTKVSLEGIVTSAVMGLSPVQELNDAFKDLDPSIRKSRSSASAFAKQLLTNKDVASALRDSTEFLNKNTGNLANSIKRAGGAGQLWMKALRDMNFATNAQGQSDLKAAAAKDKLTAAAVENMTIIQPLTAAFSEMLGTFVELNPIIANQAQSISDSSVAYRDAENAANAVLVAQNAAIEQTQDEIKRVQGMTEDQISLAKARREHARAMSELNKLRKEGIQDAQTESKMADKVLASLRKILNLTKKTSGGGGSRQRLTEADKIQLQIEKLKLLKEERGITEEIFKEKLHDLEFEKEVASIQKMRITRKLKANKIAQAEIKLAQKKAKIQADIADKERERMRDAANAFQAWDVEISSLINEFEEKASESLGKSLVDRVTSLAKASGSELASFISGGLDSKGESDAFSIFQKNMTITHKDLQDLESIAKRIEQLRHDTLGDEEVMKALSALGKTPQDVNSFYDALASGIKSATEEARLFLDVMEGIDTVAGGLAFGLGRIGDGLDIIEEDFNSARLAYEEAVEAGRDAADLAELMRGVEQADWDRFRLAMDMARESLSAIEAAQDPLSKVQGALTGISRISAVFVDDIKHRAAIQAAFEAAMAVASFAMGNIPAGLGHTAAFAMFTAIAAGAAKPPQRPSGVADGGGGGGGGGNRSATINVHMSGLTSLTQAEVGQQVYNAMGAAKSQGYIP